MARGKRSSFVAQANVIWAGMSESTTPAMIDGFIQTGLWQDAGSNALPMNEDVLAGIQKQWDNARKE